MNESEKIYIYGAGKIGKSIACYIEKCVGEHRISGYIVTDNSSYLEKNIYTLDDIGRDSLIILGLDEKYHLDVLENLYEKGFAKQVFPYNGVGFREMMQFITYENSLDDNVVEPYENLYGYENSITNAARK